MAKRRVTVVAREEVATEGFEPAPEEIVFEHGHAANARAHGPMRVCLACGEEDPAEGGLCAHDEVAVFAEASEAAVEAAERLRRAAKELTKAQRALAASARVAIDDGEAVIDTRPAPALVEAFERPCEACAAREAAEVEGARVPKRSRRVKGEGVAAMQGELSFDREDEGNT